MTTATLDRTSRITRRLDSTYTKIERLYAYARIMRSELDLARGDYQTHTSIASLIHALDN